MRSKNQRRIPVDVLQRRSVVLVVGGRLLVAVVRVIVVVKALVFELLERVDLHIVVRAERIVDSQLRMKVRGDCIVLRASRYRANHVVRLIHVDQVDALLAGQRNDRLVIVDRHCGRRDLVVLCHHLLTADFKHFDTGLNSVRS